MSTLHDAGPLAPGDAAHETNEQPRIRIQNLHKTFRRSGGAQVPAIDGIDLDIASGEFLVLLGPSGCGKTTLLRCLAGLESPDSGKISLSEKTVYASERRINTPPERRDLSMMFQSYALWPHMSVFDNVAYPLRSRKLKRHEISSRVKEIVSMVGIADLLGQYPGQLSGGQQQRVALARALVGGDDVVLFDEPLSNVDAKVRDELRVELLSMQRRLGFTAVYVTHDQHEAMSLATRIAVLNTGRVEQIGAPQDIYARPATAYVARFVGTTNELVGELRDGVVATSLGDVRVDAVVESGPSVHLSTRPERWMLTEEMPSSPNRWKGRIEISNYLGSRDEYVVSVGEHRLVVWTTGRPLISAGTPMWVSIAPQDVHVLSDASTGVAPS